MWFSNNEEYEGGDQNIQRRRRDNKFSLPPIYRNTNQIEECNRLEVNQEIEMQRNDRNNNFIEENKQNYTINSSTPVHLTLSYNNQRSNQSVSKTDKC